MKRLLLLALTAPVIASAQIFPSPTLNKLTLLTPLTAANGGTGATSSTGSGSAVLSTAPTLAGTVTVTGATGTALQVTTSGATHSLQVTDTGGNGASLTLIGNGSTTPSKTIRATSGSLNIVNDAYSAVIATLTDSGSFSTAGGINNTGIGGSTPSTGAFTSLSASTANPSLLYNQGGTGAVNRSYQSKFQESISIKDFGATGNGSTDDTASIQAAVNAACSAGGAVVNVPPGTYKIASTVTINCSYVTLRGAGKNVSTFASSSTTADTLVIGSTAPSAIQDVYVYGLGLVPSVNKTAGNEIRISGNNSTIEVSDFIIGGAAFSAYTGIDIDSYGGAIIYKIHNGYFQNLGNQAMVVGTSNGLIQDVYAYDLGMSGCFGGILFQNVSGAYLWGIEVVLSSGNAIQFAPANGGKVIFVFLDNVLADTSTGIGWLYQPIGTGVVGNIVCTKCWSAGSTGIAGVYVNGANVNGITWDAGIVRDNQQHGIWLNAGTNVVINSSQIFNNSLAGSGSYQGIVVSSGVTGFTITNNISGQGGYDALVGGVNKQGYGLLINSSTTTNNFVVSNNRFPGNVTAGSSNGSTGANQVFTNNLNF
ncbi:glycosyl hydrolase family 28-related protein [Burkholderia orbicola]|uniref:glycosyl hydrolase family 28-related protein n=1 Tax=Burkholderia orbicola TaxID=2978683 RepID=UPI0035C6DFDA